MKEIENVNNFNLENRENIQLLIGKTGLEFLSRFPEVQAITVKVNGVNFLGFLDQGAVIPQRALDALDEVSKLEFSEHISHCVAVSGMLVSKGFMDETASISQYGWTNNIRGSDKWHIIAGALFEDSYVFIDGSWPSVDALARDDGFPYGIVIVGKDKEKAIAYAKVIFGAPPVSPAEDKPFWDEWTR